MGWRLAFVALLLGASVTVACKPSCADPPESGTLDEGTLRRMSRAAQDDPKLCHELRSPRIALVADDLVLTGPKPRTIARRSDLPAGDIRRIDRLFDGLVSYREQYRRMHPPPFDLEVDMALDPALENPRALSVILSATNAGYPRARMTVGAMQFSVSWFHVRPVGPAMPSRIVVVEASADGRFALRRSELCKPTGEAEATGAGELPKAIAAVCKGSPRCADAVEIRVPATSRFGESAAIVRAVVDAIPSFDRERPEPPGPEIALLLAGSEPTGMRMPEMLSYAPRCWVEE